MKARSSTYAVTPIKKRGRPRKRPNDWAARAIYLAGAGEDSEAISTIIGGDLTPERVRALLAEYGVPILRKGPNKTAVLAVISDQAAADLLRRAEKTGYPAAQYAGALLEQTLSEGAP